MKKENSITQIRIIYTATTIFLAVLSIYTFIQIRNLIDSSDLINHTNQVNQSLQKIAAAMFEAETSKRNFILTGDSVMLQKTDSVISQLQLELQSLDSLVIGNSNQIENLDGLQRTIRKKIISIMSLSAKNDSLQINNPLKAYVKTESQKTDSVKLHIKRMVLAEEELLIRRTQNYTQISFYAPLYIVALFLGGFIILLFSYFRVYSAFNESNYLQKEFKSLVLEAPVGICVLRGKDHIYELANEVYLKLVGKREIVGKSVKDVMPEPVNQGFINIMDEVYATGKPFIGIATLIKLINHNNPQVLEDHYFDFVYSPAYDEDGKINGVIINFVEVTGQIVIRKKMEAQALMVKNMLLNAPAFICTLEGPDHVYDIVNERYQQLFGKRPLQGKSVFEALPELEGQGFDKILGNVYHTGEHYVGIDMPITLARDVDLKPELRYFNFNYQPMYDENNHIHSILVFGYEVTEQFIARKESIDNQRLQSKELEDKVARSTVELREVNKLLLIENREKEKRAEELAIANKELVFQSAEKEKRAQELAIANEELVFQSAEKEKRAQELAIANKELELFVHISSHDLQEPLRKLQIAASRMLEKDYDNLSEKGKSHLQRMQEAASSMQTLIEDLINYVRTNNETLAFENTNLNYILEEVKTELREEIEERKALIEADELHEVNIIPFQFRQLIRNLISNSLKFSNPERPLHIAIKNKMVRNADTDIAKILSHDNYYHFSISDNGIGFEAEYGEKIFEVFQRLHGKDKYKGSGIGLAIAKRIVENHNGVIFAKSKLNEGATFDIYIPTN